MLDLRVLGPLEVQGDTGPIALGGHKQRALLGLLVLNAGRVVATDRLLDELWGEHPPRTASTSLQNMISSLRKAIGVDRLETRAPGYSLRVEQTETDLGRFELLVADAQELSGEQRSRTLAAALGLWRGPPLADFAYEAFAQGEIRRLEERRLSTLEERIDADLACGRHCELVAELESLVEQQPFRERLRGQLMLALYRSGRQAEALQGYHDARRALVDELGIEPGRPLQDLFSRILRHDRSLELVAASRVPSEGETRPIAEAITAGRLVFVLGSGVNLGDRADGNGDGHDLPIRESLAPRLAAAFGCPPEIGTELTKVAQYVAITQGVGPLYDELHLLLDRDYEPGPVHEFLGELPALLRDRGAPQPLLVSTNYDRALERALIDAGEEPDVVSYVSLGRDRGKFLHRSADRPARVIQTPNAYADVPIDRRPVILKIHGDVDQARDAESFVISEDDHIAYLAETGIGGVLPVTLAARLRRSHFLFLGYGLVDWSFRVFLQRLWPDEQPDYRSWAIQPDATSLESDFWRRRGVELVDLSLEEAVARLREQLVATLEPARR